MKFRLDFRCVVEKIATIVLLMAGSPGASARGTAFSIAKTYGRWAMACLFPLAGLAQEEAYSPPKEEVEWAMQFSGISGPGLPVVGDGLGGGGAVPMVFIIQETTRDLNTD